MFNTSGGTELSGHVQSRVSRRIVSVGLDAVSSAGSCQTFGSFHFDTSGRTETRGVVRGVVRV